MSKSLGNVISLVDSDETIVKMVKKMFTDPEKRGIDGPGRPEVNPVYIYLDAFDPNREGFETLREAYRAGGVSEVVGKERLTTVLIEMMKPIHERRKRYEEQPEVVDGFLKEGNEMARERANSVLKRVRKNIGLNYFD